MKKTLSILLIVTMLLSMLVTVIPASAADTGLTFSSGFDSLLRTNKKITALPKTFEATITVPSSRSDTYEGNIFACSSPEASAAIVWDLMWTDALGVRLHCSNGTSTASVIFKQAFQSLLGQTVHVAMTLDTDNSVAKLYINGTEYTGARGYEYNATSDDSFMAVYKTISVSDLPALTLGGDFKVADPSSQWAVHHVNNWRFFRGAIFDAAAFTDLRTVNEISADMNAMPTGDANLMFWYDTANMTAPETVTDKSGNGYTLLNGTAAIKTNGLTFNSGFDSLFSASKTVTQMPKTLEATVTVPAKGGDQYKGDILARYSGEANSHYFVWDVQELSSTTGTRLRFFCGVRNAAGDDAATEVLANFDGALAGLEGTTVHLAIVLDTANSAVKLYIDGAQWNGTPSYSKMGSATADAAGLTALYSSLDTSKMPALTLGGDFRPANPSSQWSVHHVDNWRFFRGSIFDAAIFSDVRTANEIAADMQGVTTGDTNLVACYDTADITSAGVLPDKSGNGYDLTGKTDWFSSKDPIEDYAYSFVVIGDTQVVTRDEAVSDANTYSASYAGNFAKIYDWILANKEEKNIQFSFHMGDVTDWNNAAEWDLAMTHISRMDGIIPYNIIRGNHDAGPTFIERYTTDKFKSNVVNGEEYGFFDGRGISGYEENTLNAYQTITVGNYKYLMLSLDLGPCTAVIEWANEVIEAHPNHNVIISTHSYLHRSGAYMDQPIDCSATMYNPGEYYNGGVNNEYGTVYWDYRLDSHKNAGEDYLYQDASYMWNNLVKKHANVCMVLCGHDCSDLILNVPEVGDHGNKIAQLLIDAQHIDRNLQMAGQGHAGLVAMLYFSEDGKTVSTEYYSTIRDQYFKNENNYSFELDLIEYNDNNNNNNNNNSNNNNSNNSNNKEDGDKNDGKVTDELIDTNPTETLAPAATDGVKEEKDGCGSSLSISAISVVGVMAIGICLLPKKKEND